MRADFPRNSPSTVILMTHSWTALFASLVWATCSLVGMPAGVAQDAAVAEAPPKVAAAGQELEIDRFLAKEEPDFAWEVVTQRPFAGGSVTHINLTSQRWQDIVWQHALMVYEPAQVAHTDQMLLFITGGSIGRVPGEKDAMLGMMVANLCGARIAMLHQVPNQPLMGNRVEDDLITETWLQYLATGDTSWPLLFPMVKSAVKAMDALEQHAAQQGWSDDLDFVVTGASKRGWTSWLVSASDPRVVATAPMVIDILNFPKQIKHQFASWGQPSEQIIDYTSKGLIREDGEPRPGREAELWRMMDPYYYLPRVTMPKLVIVGASDRYWTTDAMNLYWDDLRDNKFIYRGANAGHGLEGRQPDAVSTLGVFFRSVASGQPMPQLSWEPQISAQSIGIRVNSDVQPVETRFWVAKSDTLDFRASRWVSQPMELVDGQWTATQPIAEGERVAIYAELVYQINGQSASLSTLAYCQ